jgi:hypothetical protein
MLQVSDRESEDFESKMVKYVEERTGFGPHPLGKRGLQAEDMKGEFNINDLTSWSQTVNEVSGNISNKIRHQKISTLLLATIARDHKMKDTREIANGLVDKYLHSLEEISRAVPLLERHLATYLDYVAYVKERAERLSAVVSSTTNPATSKGITFANGPI